MRIAMQGLLIVTLFAVSIFAQNKREQFPRVLIMAAPSYPTLAVHLNLEEKIRSQVAIDKNGKVTSTSFDRGDRNFHALIEDALKKWRFEKSVKRKRVVTIFFQFSLLPLGSSDNASFTFRLPNVVQVFARRIKVLDSPG